LKDYISLICFSVKSFIGKENDQEIDFDGLKINFDIILSKVPIQKQGIEKSQVSQLFM
jgi:hypothetical protein